MIKIIDDLLPESYANNLEKMMKTDVPWYFSENTSGQSKSFIEGNEDKNFQFGFNHIAMFDNGYRSNFYPEIFPITYFMEEKTGIIVNELYRIRLALNTCVGSETVHNPHVDQNEPHKVLLYYVNDSDGDTIMYNEVFNINEEKPENFTIRERISPKKNRAVIFDGHIYHSSSKPTKNASRLIINIDFN